MNAARELQADLKTFLEGASGFDIIPVELLTASSEQAYADITSTLNAALAGLTAKGGKSGVAVLIPLPALRFADPNTPGPQARFEITIQVMENEILNSTETTAWDIACEIAGLLHHRALNGRNVLYAADDGVEPLRIGDDLSATLAFEVSFNLPLGVAPTPKAAAPVIAVAGNVLAITATEGAIRYTLDGSYPTAETGTLYTATVTLAAGTHRIRAAVVASGKADSNVSEKTVTIAP